MASRPPVPVIAPGTSSQPAWRSDSSKKRGAKNAAARPIGTTMRNV